MKLVDYNTADVLTILSKVKIFPSEKIESETVEFKDFSSEKSLYSDRISEELCAFANHMGGVLIVGVKDNSNIDDKTWEKQLVGAFKVDKNEVEKRIRGKIQSQINLRVDNVNFESKNYIAIYIVRNLEVLVTTASGKVYMREGRDSRPMTSEEVEKAVKSLQNYDWSADNLYRIEISLLEDSDIQEAMSKYYNIKDIKTSITKQSFLEAIEVTKNGILTKGGLLFLGKTDAIREYLGDYEIRFSWKEGTELRINEIWSGNLWSAINKAKEIFNQCVSKKEINFKGNRHFIPNLDPIAFNEAFLNAIAHRDYSLDGMISIEFSGSILTITSPGLFYGGVTADNIAFHEPRHRNKALARILMTYKFIDRAGMGVLRMGVKSLVYGRSFPKFEEENNSIKVSMEAEYIRPAIFILTHGKQSLYLHDLILLNTLYQKGYLSLFKCFKLIKKVISNQWEGIQEFISRWDNHIELCGSKNEISLRIKDEAKDFFELEKTLQPPSNSDKFVKLFIILQKYKSANNEEISNYLEYKQHQSTSRFLSNIKWIEKIGKGIATQYKIKRPEDLD